MPSLSGLIQFYTCTCYYIYTNLCEDHVLLEPWWEKGRRKKHFVWFTKPLPYIVPLAMGYSKRSTVVLWCGYYPSRKPNSQVCNWNVFLLNVKTRLFRDLWHVRSASKVMALEMRKNQSVREQQIPRLELRLNLEKGEQVILRELSASNDKRNNVGLSTTTQS